VYGGKKAIFTISLHKVGFQDSHCAWAQIFRFYLLILQSRLPGLPLCMGAKKRFSPSHIQKVGFQDSHCVWAQIFRFHLLILQGGLPGLPLCMGEQNHCVLLSHYIRWASMTPTVHGHKIFAMSHFLIYRMWASRTPTVHGGKKSDFYCFITKCGLPGLPLCMGIKIQI
jgi:hypothetical protein